MTTSLRTVFFGTPETSVPYLEVLHRQSKLLAVVSQPDKPSGRGLGVKFTPVKEKAKEFGLPVYQPQKPTDIAQTLKDLNPDLVVVVAYGRLLRKDVLSIPAIGTLNVHFSYLPQYRGAAPVQWALVNGEKETGVTLFWLDEGMDTGPIQIQQKTPIFPDEDAAQLLSRLSELGVKLLTQSLNDFKAGLITRTPQQGPFSMAPLIDRENATVDLNQSALKIHNLVRGFRLWPHAVLGRDGSKKIHILKTAEATASDPAASGQPGRILRIDPQKGILVECGSSTRLWLLQIQPEGKKILDAADFANGQRLAAGDFLPFMDDKN